MRALKKGQVSCFYHGEPHLAELRLVYIAVKNGATVAHFRLPYTKVTV